MTEAEAKTKWCPFARSYDYVTGAEIPVPLNRDTTGGPDVHCLCLASACMAWRWHLESGKSGDCGLVR